MFDSELRGQMAMLMGGRAAEELTCGQVSRCFSGMASPAPHVLYYDKISGHLHRLQTVHSQMQKSVLEGVLAESA